MSDEREDDHGAIVAELSRRALALWKYRPRPAHVTRDLLSVNETDEEAAGFQLNLSGAGFGPLSFQHALRLTVATILASITHAVDTMHVTEHREAEAVSVRWLDTGVPDAFRTEVIFKTAELAGRLFLEALEDNVGRAVKKSFEEACDLAVLAMQGEISRRVSNTPGILRVEIDAQSVINEKARQAEAEERERKTRLYATVPGVLVRPVKGRPPLMWGKVELRREVKKALRELPEVRRDINGVYSILSERHPTRAPKSPQALKQLLYDKGLRLRTLKEQAAKGRKRRTA